MVPALQTELAAWKIPTYRARQIAEWMYQKGAHDFQSMTNLPQPLREALSSGYALCTTVLKDRLDSADGKTSKFLLEFPDGTAVEAVLMRQPYGNSICVSTQAGCNMGCAFCASTLHGMARDLTTGEIMAQAVYINDMLAKDGGRVDKIVIMGSGEPLLNYQNVLGFIHLVHEPYALGIGYRNITLSTSGIVPAIYQLAAEGLPLTLSISLHAPNQELRSQLMPINAKYPLADVVKAGKDYADKTKRRVTYEYILIDGLNDRSQEAEELCGLLHGQMASVNLIPINPVAERGFARPSLEHIAAFQACLQAHHVNVTVRREMGTDIQAACGQLRNKHLQAGE
jgi:23S rRNA (adenine2503-C2)-methyltransferase